jgi:putative Mn2+ efflux pump MntP
MTVLIIYAMMSWPMFVLGIYCGHLRRVAKHSAKIHIMSSWLLVIIGFLLLFGGYLADKTGFLTDAIIPEPDTTDGMILLIVLGVATAVSALPAGAAYYKLEKKHWRALVPPATGVITQAFLYVTICIM